LADQRAHRAGDVLTVMLEEVTQASKKPTPRPTRAAVPASRRPSGRQEHQGRYRAGGQQQVQRWWQQHAAKRVDRLHDRDRAASLPNGLLYIKGDRALSLNQGDEVLRLSGYVRATDVDLYNRVSSLRVANARISYSGHGALSDASQAGWLTRVFQSPLFPF
jgi:flagellar L-ring protein precursor FlgH